MIEMFAQTPQLELPAVEWSLLWPFLILALAGVLLVTITSLVPVLRTNGFPALFTIAAAVAAAAFLPSIANRVDDASGPLRVVGGALAVDHFTIFVTGVICISVLFAALVLDDYLRREGFDGPEWYVLMLLSASGGVILASANDLVVTFLGLEILSIAVYVLAALHLRRTESQEAGFKYFVLGALSSAIFLYGIAMVYGAIGSMSYDQIASALGDGIFGRQNAAGLSPVTDSSLLLAGMAMLLVGFAFKVSAVPFHMWTPDVYQGSPTPIVGFMASTVKVSAFAGLLRLFVYAFADRGADWRPLIAALAIFSLVLGSFLAIVQTDVKRMLAYSSITHAGFMLVGVHAAGSDSGAVALSGSRSVLFYMLAYTVMVSGTFAVVTVVGRRGDAAHDLVNYRGLSRQQPVLAAFLVVLLFSQAGVPFTSGFFAKFGVILAAADGKAYLLAAVAMLAAVVAAFLYLRIIVAMFLVDAGGDETESNLDQVSVAHAHVESVEAEPVGPAASTVPIEVPGTIVLAAGLAAGITLLLGIWPAVIETPLVDAARSLIGG
jgi:NADH-quinone oxidoreductase subunit N